MDDGLNGKLALLCSLAEANSLQMIVDTAFELFGNPVFIEDLARMHLAFTKCVEIDDADWQRDIVQGEISRNNLQQSKEVKEVHEESSRAQLPIIVKDQAKPYPRMIRSLYIKGRHVGVLVMPSIIKPFAMTDIHLFELFSVYVVRRMEKEHYLFSSDEKVIENFIIRILDGEVFTPVQVRTRLELLNWRPLQHMYIAVIRPEDSIDEAEPLDPILDRLSSIPYCRAFIYSGLIVFLMSRKTQVSDWTVDEPEFYAILNKWRLLAGISRVFSDMACTREHYLEAVAGLRLGGNLATRQRLYTYNEFSLYYLLERLPPEISLRDYCNEKILTLEKYDKTQDNELLVTLQMYLEHARSLSKTAELLFIHRNTVRYRINKCMELLQTDMTNSHEIFSFILSLRIILFEKKILQSGFYVKSKVKRDG